MKKKLIFVFLFFVYFLASGVFAIENKIDINTASLEQLDKIIGIGPALGQRIINARPFSSVDDLLKVSGIGPKTLQKIKDQGLAYVTPQNSLPLAVGQKYIQPEIKTATEPITAIKEPIKEAPTGVVLNEILPSPEGADETEEWIEIFNQNNFEVDLSDWKIQDIKGNTTTYIFSKNTKISNYGYLVLKRPETKIILNNTEDGLNLLDSNQKTVDSLFYNTSHRNQSYNKIGSGWTWSDFLTPGSLNNVSENKDLLGVKDLPNLKKFDISNKIDEEIKTVTTATVSGTKTSPWFLFLIALTLTIISAIIFLILKIRFKKT